MPLGSFMAQRRDPLHQREKNKKEKKTVTPAVPREEKLVVHEFRTDSIKIHILFLGRTMSALQDFLCSMHENMSKELHREGLTYYTTELRSISDVVDKKKKLERFFWEFTQKEWYASENEETNRVYTFSISPSGTQEKTLDMVFHCCTYNTDADISGEQADAVWYLADGPIMDADVGYDYYREFIKDSISGFKSSVGAIYKPVCLLLSQMEKYGHFHGVGETCVLKATVDRQLMARCRELFCCGENVKVAVIPVQVYGGLEYFGTDVNGDPILRISESGYYQSYIPENCQVPGLHTIGQIARTQGTDFFASDSCGGMKKVIRSHFARKKGEVDWKPNALWEVTEE